MKFKVCIYPLPRKICEQMIQNIICIWIIPPPKGRNFFVLVKNEFPLVVFAATWFDSAMLTHPYFLKNQFRIKLTELWKIIDSSQIQIWMYYSLIVHSWKYFHLYKFNTWNFSYLHFSDWKNNFNLILS